MNQNYLEDVIISNYFETSELHFIAVTAIFKPNLSLIDSHNY